jgi:hypothetical protein
VSLYVMREICCFAAVLSSMHFVEISMCHVILSNGTICFYSPMLHFHVLYCYVILPNVCTTCYQCDLRACVMIV